MDGGALELRRWRGRGDADAWPTVLFLHAAGAGAWCWEEWGRFFAERGWNAVAVSLRGHGASTGSYKGSGARDYLEDLRWAADELGGQPIVVGHSLGGYLAQLLLCERDLPGVVLLASVPASGNSMTGWWQGPTTTVKLALRFGQSLLTRDMRPFIVSPHTQETLFFSPWNSPATIVRHTARMQGESVRLFLRDLRRPVRDSRANSTPALVVAAGADVGITIAAQEDTAARLAADLVILDGWAHNIVLDLERCRRPRRRVAVQANRHSTRTRTQSPSSTAGVSGRATAVRRPRRVQSQATINARGRCETHRGNRSESRSQKPFSKT